VVAVVAVMADQVAAAANFEQIQAKQFLQVLLQISLLVQVVLVVVGLLLLEVSPEPTQLFQVHLLTQPKAEVVVRAGLLQLVAPVELEELVELEVMAEQVAVVPVTVQRPRQRLPSLGIYILEQSGSMGLQQVLLVLQLITVAAVAVV
jgi:hypothetical protein